MPPAASDSASAASSSAGAGADVGDAGPAGLLGGEIVIDWVSRVLRYNSPAHTSGEYGSLYITNFRVVFVQAESNEVVIDPSSLPRTFLCCMPSFAAPTLSIQWSSFSECDKFPQQLLPSPRCTLAASTTIVTASTVPCSPFSCICALCEPVPPAFVNALLVHCDVGVKECAALCSHFTRMHSF